MLLHSSRQRRSGTGLLEGAFVFPATFTLIFGLIIGGLACFRYQEVAHLAREAARFAATHGGQYAQENAAAITAKTLPDVNKAYLQQMVQTNSQIMDLSQLSVTVTINTPSGGYDWDDTTHNQNRWPESSMTQGTSKIWVTNTVSVTVSYQWTPELYVTGPITLTSTATLPMTY